MTAASSSEIEEEYMKVFEFQKRQNGFIVWFNRMTCNGKQFHSKSFSIDNHRKAWIENGNKPRIVFHENGGRRKQGDKCFDVTLILGYILINYTNWQLQPCAKEE
jgi:hypothetical protein